MSSRGSLTDSKENEWTSTMALVANSASASSIIVAFDHEVKRFDLEVCSVVQQHLQEGREEHRCRQLLQRRRNNGAFQSLCERHLLQDCTYAQEVIPTISAQPETLSLILPGAFALRTILPEGQSSDICFSIEETLAEGLRSGSTRPDLAHVASSVYGFTALLHARSPHLPRWSWLNPYLILCIGFRASTRKQQDDEGSLCLVYVLRFRCTDGR
ncbi:hypothetical protein CERZMDRAFT_97359 [Cercospora zeae-maydis SCOH1-5]|uniref:Uncharacterized protein n=1 Tax=Cercospora zeae-maydis SCOH1-5 TaxID=717836 RepID=A0A6A6FHF7_9PEZI|nr:hypothetical protein CERZMDRAFT_97359 [Cercospora zeae-maydis SCOH1-5]